jgi:hypothetical protein
MKLPSNLFRNIGTDLRNNKLNADERPLEADENPSAAHQRVLVQHIHGETHQAGVGHHGGHRQELEDREPGADVLRSYGHGALVELTEVDDDGDDDDDIVENES